MIRKIRTLKRKIRRERKLNPIVTSKREEIINKSLQNRLQILNLDIIKSDKIFKDKAIDK